MVDTTERWEQLHKLANFSPLYPAESVIRWTFKSFPRGQRRRLLDIGAGHGRHTIFWAQQGHDVVATDAAASAMKACKLSAGRLGLDIECKVAAAGQLPFPEQDFDGILSYGVYYYALWCDWDELFAEAHRLLRPQGRALLVVRSIDDSRCTTGTRVGQHVWRVESVDECPWATEVGMPMTFVDESDVRQLARQFSSVTIDRVRFSERGGRLWNDDLLVQVVK